MNYLADLLHSVIEQQEDESTVNFIKEVQELSIAVQESDTNNFEKLKLKFESSDVIYLHKTARMFALFLALGNVAEEHEQIEMFHLHNRDIAHREEASLAETLTSLLALGFSKEELYKQIMNQRIELVLTAHPTEIVRRTLLQKYNKIYELLKKNENPQLTDYEKVKTKESLKREIAACWNTNEIRTTKLKALDEIHSVLAIIEQTLWQSAPAFLDFLDYTFKKYTNHELPLTAHPVSFGSWIGGDRDGNPFVTSKITWEAVFQYRLLTMKLYLKEIDELADELSMSDCNQKLLAVVGDVSEPYRTLLSQVKMKITQTTAYLQDLLERKMPSLSSKEDQYQIAEDLLEPLMLCYESLEECGDGIIARGRLAEIIRRIASFGITLVKLDIRQNSQSHIQTLNQITQTLEIGSYAEWTEKEKIDFLIKELRDKRPLVPKGFSTEPQAKEVLETFDVLSKIQNDSLGVYIVSMTKSASDVLGVYLLQKEFQIQPYIPVVPLFETVDDLRNACSILKELFSIDWYMKTIDSRQEVMIGYSDSAKDGGKLTASWELYKAQENIVKTCKEYSVQLNLFHGRGGTIGRGGGPTYKAIFSQPPGSVDGVMRVTEQGEMIHAKFGLPEVAMRTFEVYSTAVIMAGLNPSKKPKKEWVTLMERVSEVSRNAYQNMVKENPDFISYFNAMTPIQELDYLNIGSRPSRREVGSKSIQSLRAIPWVFAWTQVRLLLPSVVRSRGGSGVCHSAGWS